MPVIIKRLPKRPPAVEATQLPAKAQEALKSPNKAVAGPVAKPDTLKIIGNFKILPVFDPEPVKGKSLFIVSKTHRDRWYYVRTFNDQDNTLHLTSPHGAQFESNPTITARHEYRSVLGPPDATKPSREVLDYIQGGVHADLP
jgi:hypothetical protein